MAENAVPTVYEFRAMLNDAGLLEPDDEVYVLDRGRLLVRPAGRIITADPPDEYVRFYLVRRARHGLAHQGFCCTRVMLSDAVRRDGILVHLARRACDAIAEMLEARQAELADVGSYSLKDALASTAGSRQSST